MKTVTINFTDDECEVIKTYAVSSLKTGTMDKILEIAEDAEQFKQGEMNVATARKFFDELKGLICTVFKHKFEISELNEYVEQDELMRVYSELCNGFGGSIPKN